MSYRLLCTGMLSRHEFTLPNRPNHCNPLVPETAWYDLIVYRLVTACLPISPSRHEKTLGLETV